MMSHGHKFFDSEDGYFGLTPDETIEVKVLLAQFELDNGVIRLEMRTKDTELLVYISPKEAMQLAVKLRKMAIAAFEAEAIT
jgi:hypothetical protein